MGEGMNGSEALFLLRHVATQSSETVFLLRKLVEQRNDPQPTKLNAAKEFLGTVATFREWLIWLSIAGLAVKGIMSPEEVKGLLISLVKGPT